MASEKFLNYFQRELNYLRNAGSVFASKHPKIARRLDWTKGDSSDPHVERLIESFAFLSAQLHQNLDDRFPQIAAGLLNVLYPQLINPLPSVSVAQFDVDPLKAKMTTGYPVERHTSLFAYAEEGLTCRFRTTSKVMLWPITLTETAFVQADNYIFKDSIPKHPWYLKLTFQTRKLDFSDLDMDTLTFYLSGGRMWAASMYQAFFGHNDSHILFSSDGKYLESLPPGSIEPRGFKKDEQILPSPSHSHPSYQLLQEYFHFPEKYLFFSLKNLLRACKKTPSQTLEIFIPLGDNKVVSTQTVAPENFLLGCTPIVNLFPKVTDPVRLNQKQVEYRLTPDSRLERTHEIFSIESVHSVADDGSMETYAPYYSFEHGREGEVFWYSRRQLSDRRNIPGTDVYLAFVNQKFDPLKPPTETIYANILCTNRFLAEQIPAGAALGLEGKLPVTKITCLEKPVTPAYSPADGETLWKLVSQLAIHHLGYTDPSVSLKVLKETLHLYAGLSKSQNQTHIDALTGFTNTQTVKRLRHANQNKGRQDQAWMGFVRGLQVDLTLDEQSDPSGMSFVLAHVLRHFLALNVAVDSFVEMNLHSEQRKGVWLSWSPLSGQHLLL